MLEALEAPRGALVVMDRGVATEDRIQWLRQEGYRTLVASRQGARQFGPGAFCKIRICTWPAMGFPLGARASRPHSCKGAVPAPVGR